MMTGKTPFLKERVEVPECSVAGGGLFRSPVTGFSPHGWPNLGMDAQAT